MPNTPDKLEKVNCLTAVCKAIYLIHVEWITNDCQAWQQLVSSMFEKAVQSSISPAYCRAVFM